MSPVRSHWDRGPRTEDGRQRSQVTSQKSAVIGRGLDLRYPRNSRFQSVSTERSGCKPENFANIRGIGVGSGVGAWF